MILKENENTLIEDFFCIYKHLPRLKRVDSMGSMKGCLFLQILFHTVLPFVAAINICRVETTIVTFTDCTQSRLQSYSLQLPLINLHKAYYKDL